uniref:Uncharacterized protein n=1 Tax=Manihot esculenta TaxID=3983 RepID=A0A2C9UQP3_MANES
MLYFKNFSRSIEKEILSSLWKKIELFFEVLDLFLFQVSPASCISLEVFLYPFEGGKPSSPQLWVGLSLSDLEGFRMLGFRGSGCGGSEEVDGGAVNQRCQVCHAPLCFFPRSQLFLGALHLGHVGVYWLN